MTKTREKYLKNQIMIITKNIRIIIWEKIMEKVKPAFNTR